MPIRVVVADDDAGFRTAAVAVLRADSRFDVVDEVGDSDSAVAAVKRHRPDAVLLDLRMPGGGGVAAARAITALGSPITLTVSSARVNAAQVCELLAAGVRGIAVKGRIGAGLPDLIERCCGGEVLLATPSATDGLMLFASGAR